MNYRHRQEGRTAVRVAHAAKQLGVDHELLTGLIRNGQVEGYEDVSPKGNRVFLIYADEVRRLRGFMST